MSLQEQTKLIEKAKQFPSWTDWTNDWRVARREMMIRLYDDGHGLSMEEIGKIYNCSKQRVSEIINGEKL